MNHYKPQDFLNLLHEINIPDIYASNLNHADAAELVKQKLQELRKLLLSTMKTIEAHRDEQVELEHEPNDFELEPYAVIDALITRLETRNIELETTGLREPLMLGRVIYGVARDWHVNSEIEAKLWTLRREKQAALLEIQEKQTEIMARVKDDIDAIQRKIIQIKSEYETQVLQDMEAAEAQLKQIDTKIKDAENTIDFGHDGWKYTSILLIGVLLIAGVITWAAYTVIVSLTTPPVSTLLFAGVLVVILFLGTVLIFGFVMADRDSRLQARNAQKDIILLIDQKNSVKPALEKRMVKYRQYYEKGMDQLRQELEEASNHQELTRRLVETQLQVVDDAFEKKINELEKPVG